MSFVQAEGFSRLGMVVAFVAVILVAAILGMVAILLFSSPSDGMDTSDLRSSTPAGAVTIRGRAQPVRDPGVVVVNFVPIRLARLSCPGPGTEAAEAVIRRMAVLVGTRHLECDLLGRRVNGIRSGQCRLPDGTDIAARLRAEGECRGTWFRM